jgi:UDP-N-acetylglucosamine diphosphorylase / glucose-1-phosphate thymidylyltransferase / UDP-N-acetylgalactosamine diphosphorylase / glucosamine-1-phosphate N-acetyltransferase / galactosamine-1-phosphate N-acetyltransferase
MQAVILAGGKGIRMRPLTSTRCKPLVKIFGRTIMDYNLEALDGLVDEIIIIVGYRRDQIIQHIGNRPNIRFVVQEDLCGTGRAVFLSKPFLKDNFIVMNGDDIYSRQDVKDCINKCPSLLLSAVDNPSLFGVVECQGEKIVGMEEKPDNPKSNLVNTGLACLPVGSLEPALHMSSRGEYELVEYINMFLKDNSMSWSQAQKWFPVSYPWQMLDALERIEIKDQRLGKIEDGCSLQGNIYLASSATIKSGTKIEGPAWIGEGAVVGPNAYLRGPVSIGQDVKIGSGVEIKNSIIGDHTSIAHLTYVGDSVIGEKCNLGAGVIVSNFRLDQRSVRVKIKEKVIDTGRRKLGAIIGDQAQIGVNSSLMPGTNIEAGSIIPPHSVIKGNYGY